MPVAPPIRLIAVSLTAAMLAVACVGTSEDGRANGADTLAAQTGPSSTASVATTTSTSTTSTTTSTTTTTIPPTPLINGPAFDEPGQPTVGSIFERVEPSDTWGTEGPVVALSFDDGPSMFTPYILDVLQITSVPATFFVVGDMAVNNPEWLRGLVDRGHRVGAHTRGHAHLDGAPVMQQIHEIVGGADQVDEVLGTPTVKCYRPPYREYDDVSRQVAADRGMATALWSVDSEDWDDASTDEIVQRVINTVTDGSIILLHDGGGDRLSTLAALPWIIRALQQLGFTFVPFC